jgi:hypothetical protein
VSTSGSVAIENAASATQSPFAPTCADCSANPSFEVAGVG